MKHRSLSLTLAGVLLAVLTFGGWAARAVELPPSRLGSPVSTEPLAPTYSGCGGVYLAPFNEEYEQEVVELVNAARAAENLPPLKRVAALGYSSRYHAADMAQDDYFDHNSFDRSGGDLVQTCAWVERVLSYYGPDSQGLGENIAAGYATPSAVMDGWMSSTAGHRDNILNPGYREIGVGYYQGGRGGTYWVQDFGTRSGVYPIVINAEAATTADRHVSLYIYGSGDWDEMRLRNDDGDWGAWRTFQSRLDWQLRPVVGERAVWVEMRRGTATTVSSDTIRLTAAPALGGLPTAATFIHSLATGETVPAALWLTPRNVGDDETLTWEVTGAGDWFTATPRSGTTPSSFRVQPTADITGATATYTETLVVTVISPTGIAGSPWRIELSLRIVAAPLKRVYLPLVSR